LLTRGYKSLPATLCQKNSLAPKETWKRLFYCFFLIFWHNLDCACLFYLSLANFIFTSGNVKRFGKSLYTGNHEKRQCPAFY
jgi:hypothetical protein